MSCFHPMKAFQTGFNQETKKPIYQITSYKVQAIQAKANGKGYDKMEELPTWDYMMKYINTNRPVITRQIEVPCKKCIGCRLAYSKEWANRCVLEAKEWKHNYSITLTYDTEHLPDGEKTEHILDHETGELIGKTHATLNDKDITKFMKRLRKHFEKDQIYTINGTDYEYEKGKSLVKHWEKDLGLKRNKDFTLDVKGIRFFMCGEYGDKRERPHYHMIIFNINLQDVEYIGKNKAGNNIWKSKTIDKIWGKGLTVVGNVDWEFCAYTARYIMKKQKGPEAKNYYKENGLYPEFVRMSRKPGIAMKYYQEHKNEIYEVDKLYLENKKGVQEVRPAKYYDKLYDIEYPEEMKRIKENRRKLAEQAEAVQLSNTTLSKEELLAVRERSLELKAIALKRGLEAI